MLKRHYSFRLLLVNLMTLLVLKEVISPLASQSQSEDNFNSIRRNQPIPFKPRKNRTFDYLDEIPEGYQPKPFDEDNSEQLDIYRLDVGDGVSVSVERFPEFSFSAVLDDEGEVIAPILGRISLKGLTLEEVEQKISYELGQRFLQEEPEVIALLTRPRQVSLTIIGEVIRPGYYSINPNTPLNSILAAAGGTTDRADLRSIIIKRSLVDGTVIHEKFDLYSPLIEGGKQPRVSLQDGDSLIVAELQIGEERDYDRQLVARTNIPQPSITVRIVAPTGVAGVQLRNTNLRNGSTFIDAVAVLPFLVPLLIKEDVTLMRFDPELGKIVTQTLNVGDIVEDGDLTQDVQLRDQDVIIVSRTILGKVIAGFRVITQPIRDVFGFANFFRRFGEGRFFR